MSNNSVTDPIRKSRPQIRFTIRPPPVSFYHLTPLGIVIRVTSFAFLIRAAAASFAGGVASKTSTDRTTTTGAINQSI